MNSKYSDTRLSNNRPLILHQFINLALSDSDSMEALTACITDGCRLFSLQVAAFVADKPQERALFALDASGSYKDCTICFIPSSHQISEIDDSESTNAQESQNFRTLQLSVSFKSKINVSNTVRQQVVAAK